MSFLIKLPLFLKNNLYTCAVISKALTQGNLSSSSYQITFLLQYSDYTSLTYSLFNVRDFRSKS